MPARREDQQLETALAGLLAGTIRRAILCGLLPARCVNGRWPIDPGALAAWRRGRR